MLNRLDIGMPVGMRASACVCAALGASMSLSAAAAEGDLQALKGMSLVELADLQVSIVSKRPERLADSAASVFVLTADDIRRSGYTSIPELLRLVPGLTVARVDTAEWAITSRGFNGRFANKLLVMIDGRSVYTPLFSGVFWEAFDTLLEDIERIEVIRGPGASSWGANAVNGVINIITKHAGATQGALVSAYGGDMQHGAAARYGSAICENGYLRLYAKRDERLSQEDLPGDEDSDDFSGNALGLRGDWDLSPSDALTVQGGLQSSDPEDPWIQRGDLMLEWQHARESGASDVVRFYYDRTELETGAGAEKVSEDLDTVELEYRHQLAANAEHDVNFGLGYRWYRSLIDGAGVNQADPADRSFDVFSAFVQDQIELVPSRWYLTLGTKLEHNDFTGVELQPSVRTNFSVRESSTLWAAVSRAVRTPSRGELDLNAESRDFAASADSFGLPVIFRSSGSKLMEKEVLTAYEAGYRWRPTPQVGLDLSLFYNDYEELRTFEVTDVQLATDPYPRWVIYATPSNLLKGQTYGLELVTDWRPSARLRFQAWYSLMRMDLQLAEQSSDPYAETTSGRHPQQQVGLRAGADLDHGLELDLYTRYVDGLPELDVDAYLELDARLAWRVDPHLTLALVGRNLLNPSHLEYGSELLGTLPHEISREVFLRVELRY